MKLGGLEHLGQVATEMITKSCPYRKIKNLGTRFR